MPDNPEQITLANGESISARWQPYLATLEATRMPFVRLTTHKATDTPLLDSKFGGKPYWPADRPYPTGANDEPLVLLAQINFADMPPLPDYPDAGLLQFFIAPNDDLYGASLDEKTDQTNFRVVYHTRFDYPVRLDVPTVADAGKDSMLPITGEAALSLTLSDSVVAPSDYRFETVFGEQQPAVDELLQDDTIRDEFHELTYADTTGHKIGGYAYFTQYDPRPYESDVAFRESLLLLQIDMDDNADMMWGDSGVANFFISCADLLARDFSRVMYTWDCM